MSFTSTSTASRSPRSHRSQHAYDLTIGPRATPDGRFLLWSGWNLDLGVPIRVSLFDIAGRQQATPLAASIESNFVPLAVHPSEMRAYVQLIAWRSGHRRRTRAHPNAAVATVRAPVFEARSGDGRRLSYYCDSPRSVMVVDSGDGRLLGAVALGAPAYPSVSTTHVLDGPGTTMYAVDIDNRVRRGPGEVPTLRRRHRRPARRTTGVRGRDLVVGVQRNDRPSVCGGLVRHRRARREHARRDRPDRQPAPGAVAESGVRSGAATCIHRLAQRHRRDRCASPSSTRDAGHAGVDRHPS